MSGSMNITLKVWRQPGPQAPGKFEEYKASDVSPEMSFLEMLDVVNEKLVMAGQEPIAFDHDCREGICGMCGLMINGVARYGTAGIMGALAPRFEAVRVGGQARRLWLEQATGDPDVTPLSLSAASATLGKALRDIAKLVGRTRDATAEVADSGTMAPAGLTSGKSRSQS